MKHNNRQAEEAHYAKTGRLIIYPHGKHLTTGGRDPDQQFMFLTSKLDLIEGNIDELGVDHGELQISLYYGNIVRSEDVEFGISEDLMKHLCDKKIQLRFTVLP